MGLLICCICFLSFDVLISVNGLSISANQVYKNKSGDVKEFTFLEALHVLGSHRRIDENKNRVPQYMLDLFASVTYNKTGRRRPDIRLPGNIVRSFYSQGRYFNLMYLRAR